MNSSVTNSVSGDVYLGFWTNWSSGRIRGATLTLTRRQGGFLTAFLALFAVIAGTCFWRVACFMIHYALSSEAAGDGIYHQRQAILRNAGSGGSGLLSLLRMNWVWRKHTQAQPYRRILPLITFALFTLGGFTAAGIFSSRISTSMGNEVLLSGRNCGIQSAQYLDAENYFTTYNPYRAKSAASCTNYAQRCYENSAVNEDCPTFLRRRLPWTSTHDVGCPFPGQDKICRRNSTNVRFDTGYIDSNFDLGINSPLDNRFLYRNVVECAPLNTEGYSQNLTIYSKRNNASTKQRIQYYYGEIRGGGPGATYQYSAEPALATRDEYWNFTDRQLDYTISTQRAEMNPDGSISRGSTFLPIPDLLAPAADIHLMFLSANDIIFTKPSYDDWYSAHLPATQNLMFTTNFPGNHSFYVRDKPVRVLGCTSQYQYCKANVELNTNCTPMAGIIPVTSFAESLWQTENQKALFKWSSTAIMLIAMAISGPPSSLGGSSLTSRYSLSNGIQGPLPDDQWQKEVEHWFTVTLADLQRLVVEAATGPMDMAMNQFLIRPQTSEEHLLCRSQKIRSLSYTSFSTLGLAVLLSIGGLIIGLSYTLEFLVDWIQKYRNLSLYKRLEWVTNETLQLQRLAHEELGLGTWTRTAKENPITAPGEQLAILDISEPHHPRLKSSTVKFGTASDHEDYPKRSSEEIINLGMFEACPNQTASLSDSASNALDSTSPAHDAQSQV